jgi:hypothetical protein
MTRVNVADTLRTLRLGTVRPGRALALYVMSTLSGCAALNNESNGASDVMVETDDLAKSSKLIMRQARSYLHDCDMRLTIVQ